MFHLAEQYPGDAARGGDYFTRAAHGEIVTPNGRRPERVIVTDLHEDFEGRVCVSERTVRHMGALVGLYTKEQVRELEDRIAYLEHELDALEMAHSTVLRERTAERAVKELGADQEHETLPNNLGALSPMKTDDNPVPTEKEPVT